MTKRTKRKPYPFRWNEQDGLYFLLEDDRLDEVTDLYFKATDMAPVDAMAKLDIEAALAELE